MSPGGVEWGLVSVTTDLAEAARALAQLSWQFRQEARGWTHPSALAQLDDVQRQLTGWSQEAALASSSGDYHSRLEAVQLAQGRVNAAKHTLALWWARGELFNEHRLRPVPAGIRGYLQ